jgi:acylaminoacyl-peptidase
LFGGSHGGFLTSWLIGHPKSCHLFNAAILWNPVIHIPFMLNSSDIPDWNYAYSTGKELSYIPTEEENAEMFKRSPFSVVKNVKTPSLILLGG